MDYGYARISNPKQNIERQIRNILKEHPEAVIIKEAYTGITVNRKGWKKLFNTVKEGDTIIFDSISRMSRNAEEGFNAYEELYKRGVNLVFLKESYLNTATFKETLKKTIPPTGTAVDLILDGINAYLLALAKEQIRLGFEQAEKEVQDLHQRTSEGLLTAKLNGKQVGRKVGATFTTKKSIAAKEIILKHSKDFGGSLDDTEVIKLCGISRNTYYSYKKQLKQDNRTV